MKWLTCKSRLEQSDVPNKWYLLDNEVYRDEDGQIYLVPRGYLTDNYTIPDWIAWLAGCKSKFDVRPSHIHDFGCQYHQLIRVVLSERDLKRKGYLRCNEDGKVVCEDIPVKYLSLVPVTKWEIDCLFKRAMKATGKISAWTYSLYRSGVFFNIGWLGDHPPYDLTKIYNETI